MSKKHVKFLTYGCQMNFSDAERMEGELAKLGYQSVGEMDQADLIIINTMLDISVPYIKAYILLS